MEVAEIKQLDTLHNVNEELGVEEKQEGKRWRVSSAKGAHQEGPVGLDKELKKVILIETSSRPQNST